MNLFGTDKGGRNIALTERLLYALAMTAGLFVLLLFVSPVPEQGQAAVMAAVFALLGGGMTFSFCKTARPPAVLIFFAAALAVGMALRTLSLTQSNNSDYLSCLKPWAQGFRENGWGYIVETWSDYNMPYLYIIGLIARVPMNDLYLYKLVSVAFDCGLVLAALRLTDRFGFGAARKALTGAAVFLAPTVWLNSSFWGQCDSIYVFFCLAAFVFALEERPNLSVAMAAVAVSFKFQAIFFFPIYLVLWMIKRVRLRQIPVFLGVFVGLYLPALALGRPFADIVRIYARQSSQYADRLNLNSPSAYALLRASEPHGILFGAGLLLAFLFLGALLLVAWLKRDRLNDKTLFLLATAMVLGIPWLLPSMHERYFYLADIFCVFLAVLIPERWYFGPFCVLCSYAGYHAFLFMEFIPYIGLQIPSLIVLFLAGSAVSMAARELYKPPEKWGGEVV
ncbi:MAG: glycosyltransferase 87 family protein [Oscillospiraceae bacterium]|jgi:Gpi18-like mannosyltransferase|nr:glycosyltransferase 87 family protein [Oscillospiraceae bacterium]